MRHWMRRLRGALGMGLTWGAVGFLLGGLIELIWNLWPAFPLGPMVDIWPAALAYPGFLGGAAFSVVLAVAGRRRRFEELSIPRFAAWGAIGGVLVSLIPAAMVAAGLASTSIPVWQITASLAVPFALGGAVAASGSLALARVAERPLVSAATGHEIEPGENESPGRVGGGD